MRAAKVAAVYNNNMENTAHTTQYPKSLADLTLADLERLADMVLAPNKKPSLSISNDHIAQICVLLNLDSDVVWSTWTNSEMDNMVQSMAWFDPGIFAQVKPRHTFEFEGQSYCYEETFLANSFGQFADAETMRKKEKNHYSQMRAAAAVFIKPVGTVYDSNTVLDRMEAFRRLPADEAVAFGGFFLARLQLLSELTLQHSALKAMIKDLERHHETLRASTAGTP